MSVYLFTKLFVFLVCSTSFAVARHAVPPSAATAGEKPVELFKQNCFKNLKPGGSEGETIKEIKKFDNVFFVATDKMLVAVAETQYTINGDGDKNTIDFLSASVDITKPDWDNKIFKQDSADGCGGWETQMATTKKENSDVFSTIKNVVYDAENRKIILLAVNNTSTSDSSEWKYNIVVGDVSEGSTNAQIQWVTKPEEKKDFSQIKNPKKKLDLTKNFIGSSLTHGGAFITNDKRIVFMLRAVNNGKHVIALIELKNTDSPVLEVLHVEDSAENCYPYLFLWGKKIVMISTNCTVDANQVVKESSNLTHWENNSGTFYYFSEFFKDKTSFTTAQINSKTLLLFAQKNEKKDCTTEGIEKNCFTFWFSDGNRVYNIGQSVKDQDVISSSLIFTNEKLFFLHQKSGSPDNKKFTLTRLEEQVEKIKTTLDVWNKANDVLLKFCETKSSDSKPTCAASLPTEGLVGFLSASTEQKAQWKSNFLNVDTIIRHNGEVKDKNSVTFNGAGARAVWPIGEQNKNQPYNVITSGFTLLARVKIDKYDKEKKGNSVLGVILGGEPKRVELWCSSAKKWAVKTEKDALFKDSQKTCEQGKTYSVAVVLRVNKLFVYIDWEEQTKLIVETIENSESQHIEHFYFGAKNGENTANTDVTISNVLLYNRPFEEQKEIEALKPKQNTEAENKKQNQNEGSKLPKPTESTTQTDSTPTGTSATTKDKDKQSSSPPPTTEDSAARVSGAVLLSLFFDVFTLLGRYVY